MNLTAGPVVLTFDAELEAIDDPEPADHLAHEVQPQHLSDETMLFVLPSRYCQSDQFLDVAFGEFGHVTPG